MKINTPIAPKLITSSENQNATIFFFFLKSKYSTSVFYDYTPERISIITGVSINTVRKYIGWLKRNGYVGINHDNLWLRSTRKVSEAEKLVSIQTKPWTTWRQFENRVYAAIIKQNIKGQSFHYNMKMFLAGKNIKKISVRTARKYSKTYGQFTKESAKTPVYNSERQIAKLFSKSKSWAHNKLILLERMGYIKTSQLIEVIPYSINPEYLENYKAGRCFIGKRGIYIHHGIKITVKY